MNSKFVLTILLGIVFSQTKAKAQSSKDIEKELEALVAVLGQNCDEDLYNVTALPFWKSHFAGESIKQENQTWSEANNTVCFTGALIQCKNKICECMNYPYETILGSTPGKDCYVQLGKNCFGGSGRAETVHPCVNNMRCDPFSKVCVAPKSGADIKFPVYFLVNILVVLIKI